jgi:hypothetical protein
MGSRRVMRCRSWRITGGIPQQPYPISTSPWRSAGYRYVAAPNGGNSYRLSLNAEEFTWTLGVVEDLEFPSPLPLTWDRIEIESSGILKRIEKELNRF